MPDIKTRDVVRGSIKTLDRSALAGQRMKQAYIRTKERAVDTAQPAQASPEEYAAERITGSTEVVSHEGVHQLDKAGHRVAAAVKEHRQEQRQRAANQPKTRDSTTAGSSASAPESPEATQASFQHRRQVEQLRRHAQAGKALENDAPITASPSGTAPGAPISAPPSPTPIPTNQPLAPTPGPKLKPAQVPATTVPDSPGQTAPLASPSRGSGSIRGRPSPRRTTARAAEQAERTTARAVTTSGRAVKTKAEHYAVKTADRSVNAGIKTA